MPGMLGTDLATLVSRYHPEIIILFLSAYMNFIYAQSAINSHAFAYLVKPIDADEMHHALFRVKTELDLRQSHTATDILSSSILRDQVLRRIALGDNTPESIMRASVLMNINQNAPCYCAILSFTTCQIPSSVKLLITSCGGISFQLSPKQYGIGFQQIDRDLPMLARLNLGLNETLTMKLSIGGVHRGANGFVCSLREALDAQGVLFESHNSLRLYRCFNEETADWLKLSCLSHLQESLLEESPEKMLKALASLENTVAEVKPSLFSLRYMAVAVVN